MPRINHPRTRSAVIHDDPAASHSAQTADVQHELMSSKPVSDSADDLEVSGGNEKSYVQQHVRRARSHRVDSQPIVLTSSGGLIRRGDYSYSSKASRSAPWSAARQTESDDEAASDTEDSTVTATDSEEDAVSTASGSTDSALAAANCDAPDSEDERDLENTEQEGCGARVVEDPDVSDVEHESTNHWLQYAPQARARTRAVDGHHFKAPRSRDREVGAATSEQCTAQTQAIYLRISHATSASVQRKLLRRLRADYPGALVVLDDDQRKTSFAKRTAFGLLWQWIQDGRVDCLWIPRLSHICKLKETFQLFEWMCQQHGVRILLQPALEHAIKSVRTNL